MRDQVDTNKAAQDFLNSLSHGQQFSYFGGKGKASNLGVGPTSSPNASAMPSNGQPTGGMMNLMDLVHKTIGNGGNADPNTPGYGQGLGVLMPGQTAGGNQSAWTQLNGQGSPNDPGVQTPEAPPTDAIMQMLNNYGSQLSQMDPAKMAQQIYAPQYAALQSIIDRASSRYDSAYSDVGQMYSALANDVRGQAVGDQANADHATQQVAQAYQGANDSAAGVTSKNNAEMAAIMQRLGVQQAAPAVLDASNKQLQQEVVANSANSANAQAYSQNVGQGQQDYVRNTGNTDALAGKNQQTSLTGKWLDQLSGYDQKYADLAGGQAQTEAQYAQSIAQQKGGYADDIMKYMQQQQDNQFKQASLDLQLSGQQNQQAHQQQQLQNSQQNSLFNGNNPYGATSYEAQQLYGDPGSAGTAMDKIVQAYSQGTTSDSTFNLGKLIASVQQGVSSPQEASNLAALASLWWQQNGNRPSAYTGFN